MKDGRNKSGWFICKPLQIAKDKVLLLLLAIVCNIAGSGPVMLKMDLKSQELCSLYMCMKKQQLHIHSVMGILLQILTNIHGFVQTALSKLRVTGFCEGNSPVTGEFSAQKGQERGKCCHLMTSSCLVYLMVSRLYCHRQYKFHENDIRVPQRLNHWSHMTRIWVSKLGHHWFRNWCLVACLAESHNMNQCWLIVNWGIRNKFNEILIEIQTFSFMELHFKMLSSKWRPFCLSIMC